MRLLMPILTCVVMLASCVWAQGAGASSLAALPLPQFQMAEASTAAIDWMKQMEIEIIPKIEEVLTPEQEEQFQTAIDSGKTFRKAFKSITLTPEQKDQLGTVLKALPKKDAFASLPPEQKKDFFMKKKELFMPTPEEIAEKIKAGMAGKESFMPSAEEISEKIGAKMKMIQEKMAESAAQ